MKEKANCRRCGEEIIWLVTKPANGAEGKWLPCNPGIKKFSEIEDGQMIVSEDGGTYKKGNEPCAGYDPEGLLWHFATCKSMGIRNGK